jgi:HEAT repeat protein
VEALSDGHEGVRGDAAFALSRLDDAAAPALGALLEALEDESPRVRLYCARLLRLVRELEQGDDNSRACATYDLERLGPRAKGAVPALLRAARSDPDPDVREGALWALGAIGLPDPAALLPYLDDKEDSVQQAAADALTAMGEPAVPALLRLLQRKEEELRRFAVDALAGIGPAAAGALPALRRMLETNDEGVREYVQAAIDEIEGGGD